MPPSRSLFRYAHPKGPPSHQSPSSPPPPSHHQRLTQPAHPNLLDLVLASSSLVCIQPSPSVQILHMGLKPHGPTRAVPTNLAMLCTGAVALIVHPTHTGAFILSMSNPSTSETATDLHPSPTLQSCTYGRPPQHRSNPSPALHPRCLRCPPYTLWPSH